MNETFFALREKSNQNSSFLIPHFSFLVSRSSFLIPKGVYMIKNILKYSLLGLAVSFIFAAITISLVKQREDVINNLPSCWQVLWLIILNCTGILAHFAARFVTPVFLKRKILNNKIFLILLCIFLAVFMVLLGGRRGSGMLIPMHKTANLGLLIGLDIAVFFGMMVFAYSVMYLIFEYKYVPAEKNKNGK